MFTKITNMEKVENLPGKPKSSTVIVLAFRFSINIPLKILIINFKVEFLSKLSIIMLILALQPFELVFVAKMNRTVFKHYHYGNYTSEL